MIPKIIIAIILIALGIAAFALQGITYTTKEKIVNLGPIPVTSETTEILPLPPIVGTMALVGGIVLLVMYCWSCESKKADQKQNISATRSLL
jgi:uncharacterized membrane protein SirB2